ncbi:MAG: response regulator [Ignavibacteriales bacterium]|nr:response regulator [Ignavibacteriota bacterium]MCB9248099.1 response regulator [Ignavibacteriales bacterium]
MKNNYKILVVDDQPDNVFLLEDRLNKEGFNVIKAYDGISAIDKVKKENPDLILLDVMMPKMDGFEVCKALSSNDKTRLTPIIMVTALNSTSDIEKGFEAGAFDYIKKPFNRVELLARIKAALRFNETNKLYLELEKINTFSSTVKKTNHEIKQPLTLINLSVTALKRELDSVVFDKNSAVKRIEFIESAVKDILNVMSSMLNIKEPEVKEFLDNLKANQFKIGAETQSLEQPL